MKNNKKTFYVTTPIYYPSGNLHIGHVYTTTLAWALRNYKRLNGYDAKMLTGADEHGQKIEQKAKEANIDPQQYVDMQTEKFKHLWNILGIDYDYYSRTTSTNHQVAIQKQFSQLLKAGEIYKGEYKGWYSVSDEEFFTPSQAALKDGKYYHPVSGHPLVEVAEESYFFAMSKYGKWLQAYFKANPDFVYPTKIVNELNANFLDKGLEDLSISRSTFSWGVPILENPKHVMYVWLDALNNYITSLGYNSANEADYQKYWVEGTETVHLVGKEITRFHCIYWPIILHAAGVKLPSKIISHGWIVTPEGKMSKSKGNVVDPLELIAKYGAEATKYFFASQIAIGQDGVFEEENFRNIINSDLANKYGNLVSRTLAMVAQNFETPIKFQATNLTEDKAIVMAIQDSLPDYKNEMEAYQMHKGFGVAIELAEKLNKYIDITQPWKLKEDKARLAIVLNNLLNGIYAVSTYLSVIIPNKTNAVLEGLGLTSFTFDEVTKFDKFDKVKTKPIGVLFERIK